MVENTQPVVAAGISSEAVRAATGKRWEDWFAILDADNAASMAHKDIALYLYHKHHVPDWWCQMLTVGYEQARGLRQKHETTAGFNISRSRIVNVPPGAAYTAWVEEGQRTQWLPHPIEIRRRSPNKTLRVTWLEDQTHLNVSFYEKGREKTQVVVEHTKLSNAEDAENRKAFWAQTLEKLTELLESNS